MNSYRVLVFGRNRRLSSGIIGGSIRKAVNIPGHFLKIIRITLYHAKTFFPEEKSSIIHTSPELYTLIPLALIFDELKISVLAKGRYTTKKESNCKCN